MAARAQTKPEPRPYNEPHTDTDTDTDTDLVALTKDLDMKYHNADFGRLGPVSRQTWPWDPSQRDRLDE